MDMLDKEIQKYIDARTEYMFGELERLFYEDDDLYTKWLLLGSFTAKILDKSDEVGMHDGYKDKTKNIASILRNRAVPFLANEIKIRKQRDKDLDIVSEASAYERHTKSGILDYKLDKQCKIVVDTRTYETITIFVTEDMEINSDNVNDMKFTDKNVVLASKLGMKVMDRLFSNTMKGLETKLRLNGYEVVETIMRGEL